MSYQQLIAQMVAAVAMRRQASNLLGAVDNIKQQLGEYLDAGNSELRDQSTEIFAHWKERQGNRHLDCRRLDDHTLRWAADNGLLDGNVTAIDAQGTSARELYPIREAVYRDPPTRYMDIAAPSWQRQKELEERAATLAEPVPAQPAKCSWCGNEPCSCTGQQPQPTSSPAAPARYAIKCDDCQQTIGQTASLAESAAGGRCPSCKQRAQPTPPEPTPITGQVCPDHGKAKHSTKSGGFYCPSKIADGSWCKWTTARAAS